MGRQKGKKTMKDVSTTKNRSPHFPSNQSSLSDPSPVAASFISECTMCVPGTLFTGTLFTLSLGLLPPGWRVEVVHEGVPKM